LMSGLRSRDLLELKNFFRGAELMDANGLHIRTSFKKDSKTGQLSGPCFYNACQRIMSIYIQTVKGPFVSLGSTASLRRTA
jgi:hypothetical protein